MGKYDASRYQRTELHMNAIMLILSYTNGVDFPIQFAYQLKATPFMGEAIRSLVRKESCWKTCGTVLLHCSQPSRKFQHDTYVLQGIAWASAKQWR